MVDIHGSCDASHGHGRCRHKDGGMGAAEMPAVHGHGNARSLVAIQTPLAYHGTAFGKTLMSSAGCMAFVAEQTNGGDLVLGEPAGFGLGYGLANELSPVMPHENVCLGAATAPPASSVISMLVSSSPMLCRMDEGPAGAERGAGLRRAVNESLEG